MMLLLVVVREGGATYSSFIFRVQEVYLVVE